MTKTEARLTEIFSETTPEEKKLIERAAQFIIAGELVAFPTETVYGLGANALEASAVRKTYEAKGRPSDNPLILHVSSVEMAKKAVEINETAETLMEEFWPGPLTLVLPAKEIVPLETRGGLSTAAVRMPANRIALELIRAANLPLSAPSANKSGRPSPTDANTVKEDLGDSVAEILDGGETEIGVESTVLDITGDNPVLLRAGGLPKEEIERILNKKVVLPQDQNIIKRSPGTRYRHYAPGIPLILSTADDAAQKADGKNWGWLGISEPSGSPDRKIIFKDTEEYAHELFRSLRNFENCGIDLIIAEIPEETGVGLALKDRLTRAAGN